jgi:formamidopyrimidine-DNA glycosylase
MIELPEALIIAKQMSQTLQGKQVRAAVRGNVPHKWAFYNRPPEEYASILQGKTMGEATGHGSLILATIEPDYVLVLGGGGERILFHADGATLPPKYHLLLHFDAETYLTVNVQGWGFAQLLHRSEVAGHPYVGKQGISPCSEGFTFAYMQQLFDELPPNDPRSIKFFAISKPGILGVGNGYLQDILFRSRIHPKRRAVTLSEDERRCFHQAIRETLRQAVEQGGRDSERDLFNRPGAYSRILDSTSVGEPCPSCATPLEKIQFLGGASYYCPRCQV